MEKVEQIEIITKTRVKDQYVSNYIKWKWTQLTFQSKKLSDWSMSVLDERTVLFRRDTSYLYSRKHNPFSLLLMMHTDIHRSLHLPVPQFSHNMKNGASAKSFCLWVTEPHLKEDWTMRLFTIMLLLLSRVSRVRHCGTP